MKLASEPIGLIFCFSIIWKIKSFEHSSLFSQFRQGLGVTMITAISLRKYSIVSFLTLHFFNARLGSTFAMPKRASSQRSFSKNSSKNILHKYKPQSLYLYDIFIAKSAGFERKSGKMIQFRKEDYFCIYTAFDSFPWMWLLFS